MCTPLKDLSEYEGKKFGMMTIIKHGGWVIDKYGVKSKILVLCKCECGTIAKTEFNKLINGKVMSCGCYNSIVNRQMRTTHGKADSSEYNTWRSLIDRCYNTKNLGYKNYGGRGITVCDRWLESFENFYADMGDRPSPKLTIDRENNNLGYSPENCRWATYSQQSLNKRPLSSKTMFMYNGELMSLKRISTLSGMAGTTLFYRVRKCGMSIEEALNKTKWIKLRGRGSRSFKV